MCGVVFFYSTHVQERIASNAFVCSHLFGCVQQHYQNLPANKTYAIFVCSFVCSGSSTMIVSLYSIRLGFVVVALRCRLQNLWELGTERISTTITKTHTLWQHYPDGALMTVLHRRRWRRRRRRRRWVGTHTPAMKQNAIPTSSTTCHNFTE